MICFFLFVHYINGDFMKKCFFIFFSFFFLLLFIHSDELDDDFYSIRSIYFYNLSTNNISDFFSDISILKIYPEINPIYKNLVNDFSYEIRGYNLQNEINNFKEEYLKMIKKNSYLDYNYLFLNGINISRLDVYISNRDLDNIINDDRLLVKTIK